MAQRPKLLERLRYRARNARTRAKRAFWSRALDRNRRRFLSQTVEFDGVPTMRGLALLLGHSRRKGWAGRLASSDRRLGVAERFGKSSQAALYRAWQRREPGANPANPPGFSSHELRSDGTALFGKRGRKLNWYELGLDASDSARLVAELRHLGVDARHPYTSPSEAHHVNVVTDPTRVLVRLGDA